MADWSRRIFHYGGANVVSVVSLLVGLLGIVMAIHPATRQMVVTVFYRMIRESPPTDVIVETQRLPSGGEPGGTEGRGAESWATRKDWAPKQNQESSGQASLLPHPTTSIKEGSVAEASFRYSSCCYAFPGIEPPVAVLYSGDPSDLDPDGIKSILKTRLPYVGEPSSFPEPRSLLHLIGRMRRNLSRTQCRSSIAEALTIDYEFKVREGVSISSVKSGSAQAAEACVDGVEAKVSDVNALEQGVNNLAHILYHNENQ